MKHLLSGLVAGAAGTVALNAVTYADMLARGRPASTLPATMARELANRAGVSMGTPGLNDDVIAHRREALGALMGIGNGLGIGLLLGVAWPGVSKTPMVLAGLLAGAVAMAASDVPAISLGKSDPTEWPVSSWLADILPHAVYGLVSVAVMELFEQWETESSRLDYRLE